MIEISFIEAHSPAAGAGLTKGDRIELINGHPIRDRLDFDFYKSQERLELKVLRKGRARRVRLRREFGMDLGIHVVPMTIRRCRNNCVFCFINQNPEGLRPNLYIKDEDFRYSFLMGNYITLSNMTEKDWKRIEEQCLSPLYISVHSTDAAIRGRLLGGKKDAPVMPRLEWLKAKGFTFHVQMVIVPGYNQGQDMEKSILELLELMPAVMSIAVVPVGLTEHRRNLVSVRKFTKRHAVDCLTRIDRLIKKIRKKSGRNILFAADEIYLKAGYAIPPYKFYGDFHQFENGVGLIASFRQELRRAIAGLPAAPSGWRVSVMTGSSAYRFQLSEMRFLREKTGLISEVIRCENSLYGKSVTVAGLLGGRDFLKGIEKCRYNGAVLLPPSSINDNGVFLDNLSPRELARWTGRKILIPGCFHEYFPHSK